MKARRLILLIGSFFSINSFSQKVTYKDLIGKWDNGFIKGKTILLPCPECGSFRTLRFIDSIHFIETDTMSNYTDYHNYKYTLDTSFAVPLLCREEVFGENSKVQVCWLIKFLGKDSLKVQFHKYIYKDNKWNDNEPFPYTDIFIRRKEH